MIGAQEKPGKMELANFSKKTKINFQNLTAHYVSPHWEDDKSPSSDKWRNKRKPSYSKC